MTQRMSRDSSQICAGFFKWKTLSPNMVGVAQSVERRSVAAEAAGS
jgi:hypothetical protein